MSHFTLPKGPKFLALAVGKGERNFGREFLSTTIHRPRGLESRLAKYLEAKWGDVQKATSGFISCYQSIEDLDISCTNIEDTLVTARELYNILHSNGKLVFLVCYEILKGYPRWMMPKDQMAKGKGKRKSAQRIGISGNFIWGSENSHNVDGPINIDSSETNNDASYQQKLIILSGLQPPHRSS